MTQAEIGIFAKELEAWADQLARDINALATQARIIQRDVEPAEPDGPEQTE